MPASSFENIGGFGRLTFEWVPNPIIVAEKFETAAARLEHVEEPLALSREVAIADVENHFATESAPDGSPWQPWAPSYAERTQASSILTLTGAMRADATGRGSWPIDGTDLIFAGSDPKWTWHQYGASRQAGGSSLTSEEIAHYTRLHAAGAFKEGVPLEAVIGGANELPARPFIGLSEDAKIQIIDIFDAWVAGTISVGIHASGRAQARSTATGRFTGLPSGG